MITVCKKRHPGKSIKLAATHRAAADLVEVGAAHVEPFRLLQVNSLARRFAAGELVMLIRSGCRSPFFLPHALNRLGETGQQLYDHVPHPSNHQKVLQTTRFRYVLTMVLRPSPRIKI